MSFAMTPCPNCGRPSDGRGTYCANCGAVVAGARAAAQPDRAVPPPLAAAVVRRSKPGMGRRLMSILALVSIGAAIFWGYWEHGFERMEQLLRPAYAPALPNHGATPHYSSPGSGWSPADAAMGAAFERVWVEGDTIDGDGYTGLRVHALVHSLPGLRLIFSAHFHDSNGAPVRTGDPRYRDPDSVTATSSNFVASAGGDDVSAFLPRGAMVLEPGDHSLQVLPALLDGAGRVIATGPAVNITARRERSYITRVRAERVADSIGGDQSAVSLKVSFCLEHRMKGSLGEVVAQFQDSQGRDVVGRAPYVNAANGLTAYREFPVTPYLGVQSYDDVEVSVPARLLPDGASALVFVEDPSTRKAVTEAVHCRAP